MEAKLKNGTLLGLAIGLVLAVMAGMVGAGYVGTKASARPASDSSRGDVKFPEYFALAQADLQRLKDQAREMLLNIDSPEKAAEYRQIWDEQMAYQVARLDDLATYADQKEEKALVGVMRKELTAYDAGFRNNLRLIQEGKMKISKRTNRATLAWTPTRAS
jgi:hypothetical protein